MKIIRIIGGLGNQMWQYALGVALKERFPEEEILFDMQYIGSKTSHYGVEIERVFGLEIKQASNWQLLKLTWPVRNYKLSRAIQKYLPRRSSEMLDSYDTDKKTKIFQPNDMYYSGYWQDYRYLDGIHEKLRDVFTFKMDLNDKSRNMMMEIENNEVESVSIHVRRGDYKNDPAFFGLCDFNYYKNAINYMKQKGHSFNFYVFSDDIKWCHENLDDLLKGNKVVYVDWNMGEDSPLDMLLMSKCSHNIIANSSFSWWATFLNKNKDKIVCAPKVWTRNKVSAIRQFPEWVLF